MSTLNHSDNPKCLHTVFKCPLVVVGRQCCFWLRSTGKEKSYSSLFIKGSLILSFHFPLTYCDLRHVSGPVAEALHPPPNPGSSTIGGGDQKPLLGPSAG